MTFEQRVRTYLHNKAATISIPSRSVQSLLKGARLNDALGDLRSMGTDVETEAPKERRRWWW